ncbi:hypothetical protein Tco_1574117, partial [Tanacetum coccineum]
QARLAREKAEKVEEANISWDNVQAMIEADRALGGEKETLFNIKSSRKEEQATNETQGRYNDAQMFDTYVFNGEEVIVDEQSEKVVEEVVSTTKVSADATITTEDITLAQALAELRSAKPKIVVQEPVQSTTTIAPLTIP